MIKALVGDYELQQESADDVCEQDYLQQKCKILSQETGHSQSGSQSDGDPLADSQLLMNERFPSLDGSEILSGSQLSGSQLSGSHMTDSGLMTSLTDDAALLGAMSAAEQVTKVRNRKLKHM